jgi:hypothetical protein
MPFVCRKRYEQLMERENALFRHEDFCRNIDRDKVALERECAEKAKMITALEKRSADLEKELEREREKRVAYARGYLRLSVEEDKHRRAEEGQCVRGDYCGRCEYGVEVSRGSAHKRFACTRTVLCKNFSGKG